MSSSESFASLSFRPMPSPRPQAIYRPRPTFPATMAGSPLEVVATAVPARPGFMVIMSRNVDWMSPVGRFLAISCLRFVFQMLIWAGLSSTVATTSGATLTNPLVPTMAWVVIMAPPLLM